MYLLTYGSLHRPAFIGWSCMISISIYHEVVLIMSFVVLITCTYKPPHTGGNIDTGHKEDQAKVALYETVAFDTAVTIATELTNEDDTLIVVTADHSSGLSIAGFPSRGNSILG